LKFGPNARRFPLRLERAEVLRDERHDFGRIEVAGEHERRVVRAVELLPVLDHLLLGDAADIRHPADDVPTVRAGRVECRVQLLLEEVTRLVLAHPALLGDDVAFGVELAEHRVRQAVGLEREIELELVLRQGHVVLRHLVAGGRVDPGAAGFLVGPPDFLADNRLLFLLVDQLGDLLLPRRDLRLVAPLDLRLLGGHLLHERVDLTVVLLVPGERARLDAHGVGPLEHHVLVEVRHPGDTGTFVHRPDPIRQDAADERRIGTLDHQNLQAVRQHALDHLAGQGHLLSGGERGRQPDGGQQCRGQAHGPSHVHSCSPRRQITAGAGDGLGRL
jgi:hypothetical protein